MNLSRTLAVTKRVFKDVKNDKRTIGLMFLAPILAMFVFGLAFSGNVEDVNTIIVNHDQGFQLPNGENLSLSNKIISNLNTTTLNIKYMDDQNAAVKMVSDGTADVVIIFPDNFTKDAYTAIKSSSTSSNVSNPGTAITVRDDESIVDIKTAILGTITGAISTTMEDQGLNQPVKIDSNPVYGKNASFIDYFVPGIMAFVVFLLTTLLTLLAFVGERTTGTLGRMLSTPLQESEIIGGYALTFSIIGTMQAALLIIIAILVFQITILGNVLLVFCVIALLAVVSQALGILLSSLAKREAQAVQFIPFIILPVFLLSGVFWPIQAIPLWLRPLSYLIPPTYAVDACRAVIVKGWGIGMIWQDILALIIFATIFLLAATWSLKIRKD